MTLEQAKTLFLETAMGQNLIFCEWETIHREIQCIVDAPNDRAAGATIQWWRCWDAKYTATSFARRVREAAKEKGIE